MSQTQPQTVDWTLITIGVLDAMVVIAIMVVIMKTMGPKG